MQLDQELAFYPSRRRLRALPGGGGGGECSWTGNLFAHLPPPSLGLARRRRRRGAQLDRVFASYAFRRRLRAWPGGAAEGGAARLGVAAYASCPFDFSLARRRRRKGAQLDRELLCTPLATDFGPGPEAAAEGRPTRRAGLAGAAQEEHLPSAAADHHRFRTTAGLQPGHMYVWVCICKPLVSECALTRRLPPTSPSLAGWPWGAGKRDLRGCFYHPLGSCSGGGLAGRTAAAAGSCWTCGLSQESSAPQLSRVLCRRLCLTYTGNRHGKKWPYTRRFPPSRLAAGPTVTGVAQEEHLLPRLSPPMLFTPPAADFGPGPEAAWLAKAQ